MIEQQIKAEVEKWTSANYSIWTIGVTDRPGQRREEHGNSKHWHQWDASTEETARRIETYFLEKGCKGAGGGRGSANYVYIF